MKPFHPCLILKLKPKFRAAIGILINLTSYWLNDNIVRLITKLFKLNSAIRLIAVNNSETHTPVLTVTYCCFHSPINVIVPLRFIGRALGCLRHAKYLLPNTLVVTTFNTMIVKKFR